MTKGLNMQNKIINGLICALVLNGSYSAYAADPSNPVAPITPAKNVAPNVNYNSGTANLDGNKDILPPTSIPQNVTPNQPANGLPQDTSSRDKIDSNIENAINLLNTPNSKIRQINRDLYKKGKVANEPVVTPKSINGIIHAHLSPGSVSPVIRTLKNRTTSIIITDMSGQPWPIVNYDGLSEEDYVVKRLDNPAPDGYVLSITPLGENVSGNLILILKGLPSPISIDFHPSSKNEMDVKTEIRVDGIGPNAQISSIGLPESMDTALLSVLQGVAPSGCKELVVSSNAAQAWLSKDGSMYVRTRYKIMAPAFENVTSSPDGTYAYKMVAVPVVLYKASEGKFGELAIEGF